MEAAVGIWGGAFASVILKKVIAEAKMVFDFDYVSKELASTMEDLLPVVTQIQSMQDVEELKSLMDTINDANELVKKCSGVKKWKIHVKSSYTKRAEEINAKMLKFCGLKLPLIMYRDHGYFKLMLEAIHRENCSVPKLDDKVPIGSDTSLMKLKGKILDDSVESLPVPVHPGGDLKLEAIHREICSVPKLGDKVPVGSDSSLMKLKGKILDDSVESLPVPVHPGGDLKLDAIYMEICSVPKLGDKVPVKLDLSLMKLKGKILDDSVESLPVSVHPSGESSGVTQLCHGQGIKGTLKLKKMKKPVQMVVGASGGALASEILKMAIREAKMVSAFEYVYKELETTMKKLRPIVTEIESMEGVEELKTIMDIIDEARVLVEDCSGVKKWQLRLKSYYTRRVEKINTKMLKFCQVELQIILLRNQGKHTLTLEAITNCNQTISERIDLMDVPVPVYRNRCSVPKLDDKVHVGLDFPLMKLKRKILDDSLESILVSAAPGCGKTTLVTELCHDPDIEGKFKHIFYSVVSSTPNFRVIVQDLLQHNGYEGVSFENDPQAANGLIGLIKERLEDGPILLVLDDVWDGADSLLKKFRIKLPGYKILATSRFDLPGFGYTYHLKPLKEKDAEALLVDIAPWPNDASQAEYEEILPKILKRCSGFPLVIEVVGVSLKGQPLYIWKGQVESWSEWETILDSPDVLKRLQPSFRALKPHLKDCFMDMGSFLEDQKIRASVIIDIWVELYRKGTSSSNSSMAYMKYLNDLASQNLLKLTPLGRNEHEDGFYNEFVVTQHDILKELAIHQSKSEAILERKRLSLVIQGDNYPDPDLCLNQRESARFLSISTDDLFSSSWMEMDLFQFPNVEALLLNISSSNYALPSFIATMKKLKVVVIINHGLDPAELTNLSCLSSLPKLKRIRLEKVSITFLDILQLLPGSLKKLSLFMCCFGEVFYDENEIDVSKSLSSLKEIDIDCCYDLSELPYWISEAVSLETLSITKCDNLSILPEAIGNLSKLQVLRLCSCIKLSELPETAVRLSNLQFLDISHCSELRKLPLEIGKLQKLKRISMRNCGKCELPDSVKNLENLEVKCDEETAFLWERLKPKMRNLRVQE